VKITSLWLFVQCESKIALQYILKYFPFCPIILYIWVVLISKKLNISLTLQCKGLVIYHTSETAKIILLWPLWCESVCILTRRLTAITLWSLDLVSDHCTAIYTVGSSKRRLTCYDVTNCLTWRLGVAGGAPQKAVLKYKWGRLTLETKWYFRNILTPKHVLRCTKRKLRSMDCSVHAPKELKCTRCGNFSSPLLSPYTPKVACLNLACEVVCWTQPIMPSFNSIGWGALDPQVAENRHLQWLEVSPIQQCTH